MVQVRPWQLRFIPALYWHAMLTAILCICCHSFTCSCCCARVSTCEHLAVLFSTDLMLMGTLAMAFVSTCQFICVGNARKCSACTAIPHDCKTNTTRSTCRDQTKILLGKHFNSPIGDVLTTDRLVFGDYLVPGADPRVYTQVTDMTRIVKVCCSCTWPLTVTLLGNIVA